MLCLHEWFTTIRESTVYRAPPVCSVEICGDPSSLGKSIDSFYATQMGECPGHEMMKGPRRHHNANMLMSSAAFSFQDASQFGSTCTYLQE